MPYINDEDGYGWEGEDRDDGPDYDPCDDEDTLIARLFQDPGGNSALRRATASNPRNLPCPTCGKRNRLTPKDRELGYQCNQCADQAERGW